MESNEQQASYTWSLLSQNEVTSGASTSLVLEAGRNPRVLRVPSYALGFAGSTYVFHLIAVVDGMSNTVNATGET